MEKQHPTASTPIHDNLATADFVTQPLPLVSPIQNHLTLPPVLPKATTGVNNIHGMPPPQNQNTVAPEPAHISPPTNQVNMISTNSPVLPLGQIDDIHKQSSTSAGADCSAIYTRTVWELTHAHGRWCSRVAST